MSWGRGYPSPGSFTVWDCGISCLRLGYPHLGLGSSPVWDCGTPCLRLGYPTWNWGTSRKGPVTSHWGTSWEGTWDQSLGYPLERTWDQWNDYGMEMAYCTCGQTERQTPVKILPSCRTVVLQTDRQMDRHNMIDGMSNASLFVSLDHIWNLFFQRKEDSNKN